MKSQSCHWQCWPSARRKAPALQLGVWTSPEDPAALQEDNACPSPMCFCLPTLLRQRKYLPCPWSLEDNAGCSHHALCNFTPFMPRLSSCFPNDKSFPLVSLSLFQAHPCANNWLISCGSLDMSRREVAFVVQRFGKGSLYLYPLGHEVRLVLTQLMLFRRAFGVSTLPAYEPCSTSTPSCLCSRDPVGTQRPLGQVLTFPTSPSHSPAIAGERPPHCAGEGCTWATSW